MSVPPVPQPAPSDEPHDGPHDEAVAAYRLSDAERNEAVAALADAYAELLLDADEFTVRMAAASEARLSAALLPLFADLPGHRPESLARAARAARSPHDRLTERTARPDRPARPPAPPTPWVSPWTPGWSSCGYPARPTPHPRNAGRPRQQRGPGPVVLLPLFMLLVLGGSAFALTPLLLMVVLFHGARMRGRR